ncbi:MAG: hypothetical protein Q8Q03_01495 [bacterium]|nr:hypothetical protein [bacterium]
MNVCKLIPAVCSLFAHIAVFAQSVDPNPTIKIIPSFGPPPYADSFAAYSTGAVNTVRSTGTLPFGIPSSPTEARQLSVLSIDDFLTIPEGSNIPFYRRNFSPTAPWHNERGGTIWYWIDVEAATGKTISLVGIQATLSSIDPNNLLGKSVNFSTNGYGVATLGIMEDETLIQSGQPSSTQVKRVIVAIGSKSFPVKNMADIAIVDNYLAQFPSWGTTISVTAGSTTVSKTFLKGIALPRLIPTIAFVGRVKQFQVIAENTGSTNNFTLQSSTNLVNWTDVSSIRAGQTNGISSQLSYLFFRLRP